MSPFLAPQNPTDGRSRRSSQSHPIPFTQRAWRALVRLVEILAGMSGIFLALTPARALVTSVIAGASVALALSDFRPSESLVYGSFVLLFLLRYAFLFWSFTPNGIARRLEARFGVSRGFAIYEAITACFFAARGLSFAWLLESTTISVAPPLRDLLVTIGGIAAAFGTAVNVWATSVVGLATYYYGDLFMGRPPVELQVTGPYRLWKNPMYGVGQLAAYGAALMALSPIGLLASGLNQGVMYLFNRLVEQPHLERA
jgi:protein-S-isoprenylcysteine O-methyltransferase Ste14